MLAASPHTQWGSGVLLVRQSCIVASIVSRCALHAVWDLGPAPHLAGHVVVNRCELHPGQPTMTHREQSPEHVAERLCLVDVSRDCQLDWTNLQ
jgi:hypothetical protein